MFGKSYQVKNLTLFDEDYTDAEAEEEDDDDHPDSESPAEVSVTKIVSYVPLFRLRYSLNVSNKDMRSLSMKWENEVLHYLNEKFQSNSISLSVSSSSAISDTVSKQARDEGPFIAIALLIFFIFAWLFISIQGNSHTPIGCISFCGIISLALSSGATFGLLTVLRVQIIEPMALLVLVVASKFNI